MAETGGSQSGESFDIEDVFELGGKIETLKAALHFLGKEEMDQLTGQNSELLLAKMQEKKKASLDRLKILAST